MKQVLEISIHLESTETIRAEFNRFIEFAKENNWEELKIYFGFAWEYTYDDIQPKPKEIMSPNELLSQLEEAESKEYGKLGDDDIFIDPIKSDVEYTFCHHIGLHIEGPADSDIIKKEKERLVAEGYEVHERIKDKDDKR